MRALATVSVILALALSGCGQPNSGSEETAAPPAVAPLDPAAIQTAVAALPAPYNEGNYQAGHAVFAQCTSCHSIEAAAGNRVGPNLHGVVGRQIGTEPNFTYSDVLKQQSFKWDGPHLDHWLTNPQADFPGTRMGFAGVRNDTQRRDLITYVMVESAH